MQRHSDLVRDMLSTRNPHDCWKKTMPKTLDPNRVYKVTMRHLDREFTTIRKVCDNLIDQDNDSAYQQLTKVINIINAAMSDIDKAINED